MKKALIIAAGRGIRLNAHSQEIPKSLIAVGGQSIIEINLRNLQAAGIDEVVIVTGYKSEVMQQHLGDGAKYGLALRYVHNPDWEKKNGVSVFAARHVFSPAEPFLLMMSDHIFAPEMFTQIIAAPLAPGEVALAIDRRIESIFDLDDAMKVCLQGEHISKIGKELPEYDAVDCGLFKCTTGLFHALEQAMVAGDCSLSDGCQVLITQNKFKAVDIGDSFWIDIDTPESLAFAIRQLQAKRR